MYTRRIEPLLKALPFLLLPAESLLAQTAADSGWRPLFNRENLNGFYVYVMGTGVLDLAPGSTSARTGTQTAANAMFRIDTGGVLVGASPTGYIATLQTYSHYRVRVQYRWPAGTAANANAGMLLHLDNAQVRAAGFNKSQFRPRSLEVNMKRDGASENGHPFTLWTATNLGPAVSTRVLDTVAANPAFSDAGLLWVANPSGKRTITSSLPNPEKPLGQWNQGEALLRGDSGVFMLNGQVRVRAWRFRNSITAAGAAAAAPYVSGGIGLQAETNEIHYRNFEIMELDSVTGLPVNATTAVRASLARERRGGGAWIARLGGNSWVTLPGGHAGFGLYNLRGRRVWSYRGGETRVRVPGHVETGALKVRLE